MRDFTCDLDLMGYDSSQAVNGTTGRIGHAHNVLMKWDEAAIRWTNDACVSFFALTSAHATDVNLYIGTEHLMRIPLDPQLFLRRGDACAFAQGEIQINAEGLQIFQILAYGPSEEEVEAARQGLVQLLREMESSHV